MPLGAATRRALRRLLPAAAVVTGPVDTCAVVTTEAFRACVEEVAADNGVDAVLAVAVPTAFSDLSAAVAEAVVSKPLAVALLDRAESVRRLKRLPVALPSGSYADTGAAGDVPAADLPAADPAGPSGGGGRRLSPAASPGSPFTPTPMMRPARWATQSVTGPGAGGSAAGSDPDGLRTDNARA